MRGMHGTAAAIAVLLFLGAPPAGAQEVPAPGDLEFEEFAGILPDSSFAFALRIEQVDSEDLKAAGLEPGAVITEVQRQRSGTHMMTSHSPEQMSDLLADFRRGDRFNITLFAPGEIERRRVSYTIPSFAEIARANRKARLARQAAMVEHSRKLGDPFGESHWGVHLRLMALGAFDLARDAIDRNASLAPDIIRAIAGERAEWIAGLVEGASRLEGRMAPNAGLIGAYGVTRSAVLGSCGEPERTISQTVTSWTDYRDGLGNYRGRSPERIDRTSVTVPVRLAPMLLKAGDVEPSFLAGMNLRAIIARMRCDDPWRIRLEDNMEAFFHHRPPVHTDRPE